MGRIFAAGGWHGNDSISCLDATHKGVAIQFGGGPHPVDWYGTLEAVADGRLDPLPSIGKVIGLDEVPAALDMVRKSQGPPRIVVRPSR
jgi:threonine dehydrogenase-like Zn-dependent dehydrogenase